MSERTRRGIERERGSGLFARLNDEKAKTRNKVIFITLAVIAVVGALTAIGFALTKKSNQKPVEIVMSDDEIIAKTSDIGFEAYNIAKDDAENGYKIHCLNTVPPATLSARCC
ncbi:MAG: hypothetical protein LBD85_01980 [Oscillospiraceae bacterium]|jgi:flagellar basal body-associated protein FliL|nr:hypothetical protein [Oscillospiraceae bacterium]